MNDEERKLIKDLSKCDFKEIHAYYVQVQYVLHPVPLFLRPCMKLYHVCFFFYLEKRRKKEHVEGGETETERKKRGDSARVWLLYHGWTQRESWKL